MDRIQPVKPLGGQAYGSIPHFAESRLGPGDHHIHWGAQKILTEKPRNKHEKIIVTEKIDGSCVSIANIGGEILALSRAGWKAESSPYRQHLLFDQWVKENRELWSCIPIGSRLCGEWVAQAHGTMYEFQRPPFFAFDLLNEMGHREPYYTLKVLCETNDIQMVPLLHFGGPISLKEAEELLGELGKAGAQEPAEGFVYRCQGRNGETDIIAKFVRDSKIDGKYLPKEGEEEVWLWQP